MPDVPIRPKPPVEPTLADKMAPVGAFARAILTGQPSGSIRRPLLFVVAGLGLLVATADNGPIGIVIGAVGMMALMLLAWSDQVVVL